MRKPAWWLLGLALAWSGCKQTQPPGCRIAQSTSLPPSALTLTRDAWIQRAGAGLVLVGTEGDEVRWAQLSLDGVLGTESKLTVPQRVARPGVVFGATSKSVPGDQLVVAYVVPKAGATNQLQVNAITQTPGAPAAAPVTLFDLPAGVDPNIIRLAMGSSQTGQRAVLTWSFDGQDAPPSFLLLKGDAQMDAPPVAAINAPIPRASCLSIIGGRTDFAVSVVQAGQPGTTSETIWRAFELKDDGGHGSNIEIGLDVPVTSCISSTTTPRGYALAYQNNDGTFFADFDTGTGALNTDIIAGVLQFGGVAKQPKVGCIAPMGREYGLLFDRSSGPEVWRFDAFGNPQGSPLLLPASTGQVGPLSALPGRDSFHATYLDIASGPQTGPSDGNSTGTSRQFIRVDCPMAAPAFTTDAAVGEAGK
jgi:hypothetical protein